MYKTEEFDVVIIGAGPGGYVAGLRAVQNGLKTLVIEEKHLGGVCLNWGCIPTKALLESAKRINCIKNSHIFGIDASGVNIDPLKIWQRKDQVVDTLRKGIDYLFKAKGIDFIKGQARLIDRHTVKAVSGAEISRLKAKNIIIASGSSSIELAGIKFDHKSILSSDDILGLNRIPKSLIIIGGGVVGCEFACLFSSFGTSVTVVELLDSLIPQEDKEISKALEVNFKKKGIVVKTKTKIESVSIKNNALEAVLSDTTKLNAELILVCVGRKPNSGNLGLESLGIDTENGWIVTDEYLRTNLDNIYAVGDITGKILLAHVATYQADIAVANISGKPRTADYSVAPNCIFTFPEIASVGVNERQACEKNINYKIVKFPFLALGKAQAVGNTEGFIKLLINNKSEQIIGAAIIGPEATELIAVVSLAVRNKLNLTQVAQTIYAHPTFSEIIPEAIFSSLNRHLHIK